MAIPVAQNLFPHLNICPGTANRSVQDNVAHKVRRYDCFLGASGLVPDVKGAPPRLGSVAIVAFTQRRNPTSPAEPLYPIPANDGFRLRRISAFLPPASWGVSSEGFL